MKKLSESAMAAMEVREVRRHDGGVEYVSNVGATERLRRQEIARQDRLARERVEDDRRHRVRQERLFAEAVAASYHGNDDLDADGYPVG